MASGKLDAIWVKRAHGGNMDAVTRAQLRAGRGIVGSANQGGRRQVTIIDRGAWDRVNETLQDDIDPALRRADLLLSGLPLANTRGRTLRIGTCRFRINGETRPCELMEESRPGLQAALDPDWRGGVFAEILDDGEIEVGAAAEWVE